MALSQREQNITVGVALAALLLAVDLLALQPYLDRRAELVQQWRDSQQALSDAADLLNREQMFHRRLGGMDVALTADAFSAEGQLLHLVHDWEQQAGLGNADFGRVRSIDDHGLTRLTFAVSATGSMKGVASMIHRVETAPMPLRIDGLRLTSAAGSGDELRVDLDLSTLCQSSPARPMPGHASASVAAAGAISGGGG